jgi:uncharacterized membrane protein YbhN (UPF0104 family)
VSRRLRTIGLPAALGLATYAIVAQWSDIRHSLDRVGIVAPLLSLAAALVGLGAGALAWRALLADVGVPLPLGAATRVFFVGQLGKYLPGGLWPVIAQMELGRDIGAGRRQVGAVGVVVMAVNVVTGLLVAVVCLPFTSSSALHRVGWLLGFLPFVVALLHPRALTWLIARVLRLLRREPLERPPTARGVLTAVSWSILMWAAFGAHLYVLADPLASSGHRLPLLAAGGYALAWVVGFVVVVAPSGAGVREAMLVLALAPAMSAGEATAVALLSRVVMTVGDLAWAGVGALRGMSNKP